MLYTPSPHTAAISMLSPPPQTHRNKQREDAGKGHLVASASPFTMLGALRAVSMVQQEEDQGGRDGREADIRCVSCRAAAGAVQH